MKRQWDIQIAANWWISVGFHIDHHDPSVTLHLPGAIIYAGRCAYPGLAGWSLRQWGHTPIYEAGDWRDDPS